MAKETPISEITLRKYEKPYFASKRELVKKICLSVGLLQPGDSRDIIVDILYILLESKKELSCEEIVRGVVELRKNEKLPLTGIAASNIRRQLRRLRELLIVEKIKNNYRITENLSLSEIFSEKIENILLKTIISRIKEYAIKVDSSFNRHPSEKF
ncbi:MAG: hypothetical protein QXG86_02035 [Candidatus Woesearchaeota archaeon]